MKILTCTSPGNLTYGDAEDPVLKKGNSIIKVKRVGICGTDLHAFEGTQPFFTYPRILGHEISGDLLSTTGQPEFRQGEVVTFIPYLNCGECIACRNELPNCCANLKVCGVHIDGGMVEYLSVPTNSLVHGQGLSYESLALVEPLAIGAHSVRRAALRKDEFVLVMGAGPIGLGIMEFSRIAGAIVIGLDINDSRLSFCTNKLGIVHTINASSQDVFSELKKVTQGDMPTVIFDATGNLRAINNGFQYMAHGARFVVVGLQKENIVFSHPDFHKREGSLMSSRNATRKDFDYVISCLKAGKIDVTNYITHIVGFENVKKQFDGWLNPATGVIKAMIEV